MCCNGLTSLAQVSYRWHSYARYDDPYMHFVCLCESSMPPDSLHALNAPEESHWSDWFTIARVTNCGFVGLYGLFRTIYCTFLLCTLGGGLVVSTCQLRKHDVKMNPYL